MDFGPTAHRRFHMAFLLLTALSLSVSTSYTLAQGGEELRAKIEDLERRLEQLEKAASEPQKGEPRAASQPTRDQEVQELHRRLEILAQEVEQLRSGEKELEVTPAQATALGLGPSAASVYRKSQGVSIAGYGEMLYENFEGRNQSGSAVRKTTQLDFLRAILYAGYRFSPKFVFNSEIELEHANEASVEFAYLDYLAHPALTLRGGLLLVPMGLVNEFHEPNVFLGARRTETESRLIPSTWRENGFGALGSVGMFNYRAYVINGLNASGFSSDGLRGGRQKGSKSKASDLAFVGRLDVAPTPGVFFGGSFYRGGSGQNQFRVADKPLKVQTSIGELHAQVQVRGWDVRGLFARASLDDADLLNRSRNLTGKSAVAETMQGGYLQVGYNVLSQFRENPGLTPYYRFEKLNTHREVPDGFLTDPARDRTFHTLGLEFRPIYNIVIKSDYQWARDGARTGLGQFNIALGYSF